jgi:hypothetical protein
MSYDSSASFAACCFASCRGVNIRQTEVLITNILKPLELLFYREESIFAVEDIQSSK